MHSVAALVIIDMQVAYFESGPLSSQRSDLVDACNDLIGLAHAHGLPLFNVHTEHKPDRSTWTLNMLEDGRGFAFAGSDEVDPVEGLKVGDARAVVKTRDSAFYATYLGPDLSASGVDTLVLAGVSTHTCIASTAMDAYARNLKVILAEDAIGSDRPELHRRTLDELGRAYRIPCLSNTSLTRAMG